MGKGHSDISRLHSAVQSAFPTKEDEIKQAAQLEILLNYLLYDVSPEGYAKENYANMKTNNLIKPLVNLLNNDIRDEILTELSLILDKNGNQKYTVGDSLKGELLAVKRKGTNQYSTKRTGDIFEDFLSILGKKIAESEIDFSQVEGWDDVTSVTGASKRIIQAADDIQKEFLRTINKSYQVEAQGQLAPTVVSTQKQMKTDVDYNKLLLNLEISGGISPWVEKILTSTITAKNYKTLPVHLENIYVSQAYLSMTNFISSRNYSDREIIELYVYYMQHGNKDFFAHLTHIAKIEALIGAGQIESVSNKDTATMVLSGPAVLPKFLIINLRDRRQVIVRSTFDIISKARECMDVQVPAKITNNTQIAIGYMSHGPQTTDKDLIVM